jgi:hypothetical protein
LSFQSPESLLIGLQFCASPNPGQEITVHIRRPSLSRLCLFALVGILLAVGVTACGGGGSNTNQIAEAEEHGEEKKEEEEKEARIEAEIRQLKAERQHEKNKALRKLKQEQKPNSSGSSGSNQSPSPPPSTTPEPERFSCGGSLTTGPDVTCDFARNVESAYYEEIGDGSGTVYAYSSANNEVYEMYCSAAPHECSGAISAQVYFP